MSPSALRTAFGMASLCTLGAIALLLLEPRGSGPFWITVWTLIIAVLFLATVITVVRSPMKGTRKGGDVPSNTARQTSSKKRQAGGSSKPPNPTK